LAALVVHWACIELGRSPGDTTIQRGSTNFYFPLVIGIVVSIVLNALMWRLNR